MFHYSKVPNPKTPERVAQYFETFGIVLSVNDLCNEDSVVASLENVFYACATQQTTLQNITADPELEIFVSLGGEANGTGEAEVGPLIVAAEALELNMDNSLHEVSLLKFDAFRETYQKISTVTSAAVEASQQVVDLPVKRGESPRIGSHGEPPADSQLTGRLRSARTLQSPKEDETDETIVSSRVIEAVERHYKRVETILTPRTRSALLQSEVPPVEVIRSDGRLDHSRSHTIKTRPLTPMMIIREERKQHQLAKLYNLSQQFDTKAKRDGLSKPLRAKILVSQQQPPARQRKFTDKAASDADEFVQRIAKSQSKFVSLHRRSVALARRRQEQRPKCLAELLHLSQERYPADFEPPSVSLSEALP